jgi:hypothetical protein
MESSKRGWERREGSVELKRIEQRKVEKEP